MEDLRLKITSLKRRRESIDSSLIKLTTKLKKIEQNPEAYKLKCERKEKQYQDAFSRKCKALKISDTALGIENTICIVKDDKFSVKDLPMTWLTNEDIWVRMYVHTVMAGGKEDSFSSGDITAHDICHKWQTFTTSHVFAPIKAESKKTNMYFLEWDMKEKVFKTIIPYDLDDYLGDIDEADIWFMSDEDYPEYGKPHINPASDGYVEMNMEREGLVEHHECECCSVGYVDDGWTSLPKDVRACVL